MIPWIALFVAGTSVGPGAVTAIHPDDLAAQARRIDAPIAEVIVYGDRARVRREGTASMSLGINVIALPDLPGGTLVGTVRVTALDTTIARVETAPIERLRSGVDRVEEILSKLEVLDSRLAAIDAESSVLEQELAWLARLAPAPFPNSPDASRPLAPAAWPGVLDFLEKRREQARAASRELVIERTRVAEARVPLAEDLRALNLGGLTQRNLEVLAVLESPTARRNVPIVLEYMVPGAGWTPAHELRFEPRTGEVSLATYGVVRQATGEDWTDASLSLSTAIPARGLEVPVLLTWALGEVREFVPVSRPKSPVPRQPVHPLPTPARRSMSQEDEARSSGLQRRLAQAMAVDAIGDRPGPRKESEAIYLEEAEASPLVEPDSMHLPERLRFPEEIESAPRRHSRQDAADASAPPRVSTSSARERTGSARFVLADPSMRLRPPPPPVGSPAALAGGLDFVYPVPARASIASTGEQHRLPLFTESFASRLSYETTPGLVETAYLRAEVSNSSGRPILGGEAALFVGGSYTGDARLETIGPGATVELPLGADEDLRVRRVVTFESATSGVVRREEATIYTHRIELASYKDRPVWLRVTDQVPKSFNENIRIELESLSPAPAGGPTETEGLVHWEVELAPGESKTLELRYRIRRPTDWRLFQN